MPDVSTLLGAVITGTRDFVVARENARGREGEIERQRAEVAAAKARAQESAYAQQKAQEFFNSNMQKYLSLSLGALALLALGVTAYNVMKR